MAEMALESAGISAGRNVEHFVSAIFAKSLLDLPSSTAEFRIICLENIARGKTN